MCKKLREGGHSFYFYILIESETLVPIYSLRVEGMGVVYFWHLPSSLKLLGL